MTTAELEALARAWMTQIGRGTDERCVAALLTAIQLSKLNDTLAAFLRTERIGHPQ